MERLVQYLDDLEDLFYAGLLLMERVLAVLRFCLLLLAAFTIPFLGVLLALNSPRLALAIASMTVAIMLYRSVSGDAQTRHIAIQ